MNNTSDSSSSDGIGFCGLLAIVFITLKLIGKIDWSWWWVLAPMWIPLAIMLFLAVGGVCCAVIWLRKKKKTTQEEFGS